MKSPKKAVKKPEERREGVWKKTFAGTGKYVCDILADCFTSTLRDIVMGEVDKHLGPYRQNRYGGYGTSRRIGFRDFDDENWNRRG